MANVALLQGVDGVVTANRCLLASAGRSLMLIPAFGSDALG